MFKTLQNAFKIKEIRQKLFYTFLMLIVIRFGSILPVPGGTELFWQSGWPIRPGTHSISLMRLPAVRLPACPYLR